MSGPESLGQPHLAFQSSRPGATQWYRSAAVHSFQQNLAAYQNLITQSMYDKQLDSGRGTLLHLCDDVIQQEVKEVILPFYRLMEQGKATREDLDRWCEELIKEEFGASCTFDVDDAVEKLEKLGIVSRDLNRVSPFTATIFIEPRKTDTRNQKTARFLQ